MNLKNIFTTALGCFAVLAACGNDNDSDSLLHQTNLQKRQKMLLSM